MSGKPIYRWPRSLRPRERAIDEGISSLSDSELIALVIGKGTKEKSAVQLGEELIKKFGSLRDISKKSPDELMQVDGIGMAKAVSIAAAFEMGRRAGGKDDEEKIVITSPHDVYICMKSVISHMTRETFWVLLLNARGKLLRRVKISEGTLTSTVVHPREVFRAAILENAASLILVHNHPSGDPSPSKEDIELTKRVSAAGEIFSIPVIDHVIVADNSYVSLREKGYIT